MTNVTPKKAKAPVRHSEQTISDAILKCDGNISAVARMLNTSRNTLHKRIKASAALSDALADARETMLDEAENSLMKAIRGGEGWAVCFALKTVGKGRGYIERQEVENRFNPDNPLTVRVVYANDHDDSE
jgi:transcriptional regulator of acetoin/glycerol metabolism